MSNDASSARSFGGSASAFLARFASATGMLKPCVEPLRPQPDFRGQVPHSCLRALSETSGSANSAPAVVRSV
jgi:hypothetical protein